MHKQNGHATSNGRDSRLRNLDKWASLIGGGALAVYGITRKSLAGTAVTAAGGYLIYRGTTRKAAPYCALVQQSFTIMRPVGEVYSFWRDFSNLAAAMRNVCEVQTMGDRLTHWTVRGPAGTTVEWDAEITEDVPNERLSWHTREGSQISHSGSVHFRPILGGEATELSVSLQYEMPGGRAGSVIARLFGKHPEHQIREDLRALKSLLEAGEAPTTDGQPSGRRSLMVRMMQTATETESRPGHQPESVATGSM